MPSLDPALSHLAQAQGGVFSSRQAQQLGATLQDLGRLTARGEVVRVRHGAYRLPVEGDRTPEERYVVGVRAVLVSRPRPTWASHHAALALAGLPLVEADLRRVDVCVRPTAQSTKARSFRRSGVVTHPLPDDEVTLQFGSARCVSMESAVILTAGRSGVRTAVVALDAALHRGLVCVESITTALERDAWQPLARRRARTALGLADASCESPGESLTRLLLTGLGWRFRSQVRIRDTAGLVGRVDFLLGDRVVVEFDGLVKYAGADGRSALAAEKAREDRLRAAGYEVVRLVWSDLADHERVARLIRAAAVRAAQRSA
jgi:very-short-patch-repair endonuclease